MKKLYESLTEENWNRDCEEDGICCLNNCDCSYSGSCSDCPINKPYSVSRI